MGERSWLGSALTLPHKHINREREQLRRSPGVAKEESTRPLVSLQFFNRESPIVSRPLSGCGRSLGGGGRSTPNDPIGSPSCGERCPLTGGKLSLKGETRLRLCAQRERWAYGRGGGGHLFKMKIFTRENLSLEIFIALLLCFWKRGRDGLHGALMVEIQ